MGRKLETFLWEEQIEKAYLEAVHQPRIALGTRSKRLLHKILPVSSEGLYIHLIGLNVRFSLFSARPAF